ncbi:hypothetical protein CERSUDRAFT_151192 [Gelatoporia subvermispora B]|uniref:Uncharacterized protein n=1 Tax=Ceriporiopsis subvermispora (strain B) TaxID=914234 RepID=M2PTX4_CERS8|nr:hypothetical protein CERSUDRAFT_151192 [Gelatoporia subvermispora B]
MCTLDALLGIISNSVKTIQAKCKARGVPFPSIDEPFDPESDAIRAEVIADAAPAIAAAQQLIATLDNPGVYALRQTFGMHISSAIGAMLAGNIAEIMRESDPNGQGMKVEDIAKQDGIDPVRLGRLMRLLTNYHIFTEVNPGAFKHNRISSTFDTGKSVDEIKKSPADKYLNTAGPAALFGHTTDECFKAAAYLSDYLTDKGTVTNQKPNGAVLQRAMSTHDTLFEWYEQAGNEARRKRFNVAMRGVSELAGPMTTGFDWKTLSKGGVVVDVGGGIGATTMRLADNHPHLCYIVQDRPSMVDEGEKFWKAERPEALRSGLVQLQAHDMFQVNPVRNAAVFLLRCVIHDWSDHYATTILQMLRASATPDTRLMIVDPLIRYACPAELQNTDVPGVEWHDAPAPLLPNMGIAGNFMPYHVDFHMLTMTNSQERTCQEFKKLFEKGGWKLERVYVNPGVQFPQLIGCPAQETY